MAALSAPRRAATGWSRLAQSNPAAGVVDTLLRGIGQVMFQNNPLTGLLFLAGIFVNSAKFGGSALLGLAASTLAAYVLGADRALIRAGLFGFNGVLVGIALAFFLEFDLLLAVYIVLGAAVSTVVMMALVNLLSPWDMPALTAPFVLTTWLLVAAVYQFSNVRPGELIVPLPLDPQASIQTELRELATAAAGLSAGNLVHALFRGIGEVMFQDNLWTGVIFLVAILVNSRISAAFAVLGSAAGLLTALAVGADGIAVFHGLYGFNAVLTAIALGGLFFVLTWRSAVYALVAAVFTTLAFAGIAVLLSPVGLPALTAPFVLVTWLFLLPKRGFRALEPVPVADVTTAERIRAAHTGKGGSPRARPGSGEAASARREPGDAISSLDMASPVCSTSHLNRSVARVVKSPASGAALSD